MMSVYLTALSAVMLAMAAPGPGFIAVSNVALTRGRRAAASVAAGLATGAMFWVAAFAAGANSLLANYPIISSMVQLLGGCYFLYLGFHTIHAAVRRGAGCESASCCGPGLSAAYKRGLIVVLTNPLTLLTWASITTYMTSAGIETGGMVLFVPVAGIATLGIYCTYGVAFSNNAVQLLYRRNCSIVESVFGTLFNMLGMQLLVNGLALLM